jgi:prepilin-type processing-associated H-X9-DG protein
MRRLVFTLTELLIVIAIIMILMSLLMPALKAARKKVYESVCASNLRQQGVAVNMMAGDSDDYLPYGYMGGFCPSSDNKYGWAGDYTHCSVLYKSGYITNLEIFFCAASGSEPSLTSMSASELTTGAAGQARRSYIVNRNFMSNAAWSAPWGPLVKMSSVRTPSKKLLFMDGVSRAGVNIIGTVTGGAGGWCAAYDDYNWTCYDQKPALRHNNKCNAVFIDGHAERRDDTWTNAEMW